jgi:long-chain acyl-CoA synthetase
MNLAHVLREASREHAGRCALHTAYGRISYAELERRASLAATMLHQSGVKDGDRVGLRLPNGPEFAAAWFGALRLGAIVVPLNILLARPEIEERMRISGADVLIEDPARVDASADASIEPWPDVAERDAEDPAVILFTSGTSGGAKGAVLTHGGIRFAARAAAEALALTPDDVLLGAAPFSHVLGQSTGLVGAVSVGASIAIVERFEAEETLRYMTATGTTILLGVPTMCIALCEVARSASDLPRIRIAHVGGAPVPAQVALDFERTFGGEVYEGYGLTELSGIATTYVRGQRRKTGSVGMPLAGTQLRIVGDDGAVLPPNASGEVQLRGPSVIPRYWGDDEATASAISPEGWLATGDVGYVDDEGYLFLVDRVKDVIIRGGYNVYPREIEEVLYGHPDVLEAAVVGLPDPKLGEEVAALVVAKPGAVPDPDAIRGYARERVAAYKYPRRVLVVESLPKGPTGKILKREIDTRALAGDGRLGSDAGED